MEKLFDWLSPLKIPAEISITMLWVLSLFLILAPDRILSALGLIDFVTANTANISIVLLLASAYFIALFLKFIFDCIKKRCEIASIRKTQIEQLIQLSPQIKKIVIKMYKNGNTMNLDINSAKVGMLTALTIIGRGSDISVQGTTFGYYLQPWVIEYLNKNYCKFSKGIDLD